MPTPDTRDRSNPADAQRAQAPGQHADAPQEIPAHGWLQVAKRVKTRLKDDNGPLLAAGVAFFGLLALFPALTAMVSLYGLFADPADVQRQIDTFASTLPAETKQLISDQLSRIVSHSSAGLSLTAIVALVGALWSASSGIRHLLEAVNAAYAEANERGFVKTRLQALGFAVAAIVFGLVLLTLLTVAPSLAHEYAPALETPISIVRWPLLALAMLLALAIIYRVGPDRDDPKWRWTTPGSLVALVLWLVTSVALAVYAANFGKFDATYGSMGAIIVTMLWLYLSSLCILIGAYVNAELEHQTVKDTTVGADKPRGEREAVMADAPPPANAERESASERRARRAQPSSFPQAT